MSHVTDIILVTFINDDGGRTGTPPVVRINKWLRDEEENCELVRVDKTERKGYAIQCNIYVGCGNYMSEERFFHAVMGIAWQYPECVQLMMKREEEDQFTVFRVGDELPKEWEDWRPDFNPKPPPGRP